MEQTTRIPVARLSTIVLAATCLAITLRDSPAAAARAEAAVSGTAVADATPTPATPGAAPAADAAARATRVRDFVAAHQPELADLLARLEKRKPEDYAAAVADLDRSVVSLTASRAKDERLYEIELRAWQARTSIDLLVARWMTGTKKTRAGLEPQIRAAIVAEIDARADLLAYRKQRSAAWYDRQIVRLREKQDAVVADRLESLLVEPGAKKKSPVVDRRQKQVN